MKKYVVALLTAAALASAPLVLAGAAAAAPSGPMSTVEQTVRTLEASGYNVILSTGPALRRCRDAPSARCVPAQFFSHSTTDTRRQATISSRRSYSGDRLRRPGVLIRRFF